jgi:acyl-[acyl-carrier-protein]-phospholipid O-acyltransferase/long-chain-fatty-acid--[acyl-carrier-protein] ligase
VQERLKQANSTALMVPRNVISVAELPLLGSGKTDYQTLNRMAHEQVKP